MFSIHHITEDGFEKIILKDDASSTSAAIIPSCGAVLHAFSIAHNNGMLNVIDSYDSLDDFNANVTAKGFKGSKLSPFVCRMKQGKYHYGQEDHTIEKFYLGEHAIHGLVYDAPFSVTGTNEDENNAWVSMKYEYRGTDKGYPFNYDCIVTYFLEKDNKLTIQTRIENKSDGIIPVQDGWHPYFGFGGSIDELQFEFQSKEIVEFDEGLVPTGKLLPYQEFGSLKKIGDSFFDNCFTLNFHECQPLCVLRDQTLGIQLEIHPGTSYPYLQVYTPPHRNSIAIENLSGAPDGFNNGMGVINVEKGEKADFSVSYILTCCAIKEY